MNNEVICPNFCDSSMMTNLRQNLRFIVEKHRQTFTNVVKFNRLSKSPRYTPSTLNKVTRYVSAKKGSCAKDHSPPQNLSIVTNKHRRTLKIIHVIHSFLSMCLHLTSVICACSSDFIDSFFVAITFAFCGQDRTTKATICRVRPLIFRCMGLAKRALVHLTKARS